MSLLSLHLPNGHSSATDSPPMRHCARCAAPNPASRALCYSCGYRLADSLTQRDDLRYACLNCRTMIAYSTLVCPVCGRISPNNWNQPQSLRAVHSAPMLGGWEIAGFPDGSVRLTRSRWQQFMNSKLPYIGLLFSGSAYTLGRLVATEIHVGFFNGAVLICVSLLPLLVFCTAHEEWRIARDRIERHTVILGIECVKCVTGAVLYIEEWTGMADKNSWLNVRELRAKGNGGTLCFYRASSTGSTQGESNPAQALWGDGGDLTALGRYLAAQTGWHFRR